MSVRCLASHTSLSRSTSCLPRVLIAFVSLRRNDTVTAPVEPRRTRGRGVVYVGTVQGTDLTTVCVISCTSAFFLSAMSSWRSRITFMAEPSSTRLYDTSLSSAVMLARACGQAGQWRGLIRESISEVVARLADQ